MEQLKVISDDWINHQVYINDLYKNKNLNNVLFSDYNKVLEQFQPKITENFEAVGDLGCGPKPFLDSITADFKATIDTLAGEFEYPREYNREFHVSYEVPDQFFTCITCLHTVNYVQDYKDLIFEINRLLEDEGQLFLTCNFNDEFGYKMLRPEKVIKLLVDSFDNTDIFSEYGTLYFYGERKCRK